MRSTLRPLGLTALLTASMAMAGCASLTVEQQVDDLFLSPGVMQLASSTNDIFNPREDKRVVCSRYKPTGSHRPVLRCVTKNEHRDERRASEDYLDDMRTLRNPSPARNQSGEKIR